MQENDVNQTNVPSADSPKTSRKGRRTKTLRLPDIHRTVRKLLSHAAIIIALMLITFFVIDRVNKPMGFMTNEFHKLITFALALISIFLAVEMIAIQRRLERAVYSRRIQAAHAARQAKSHQSIQSRVPQPPQTTDQQ